MYEVTKAGTVCGDKSVTVPPAHLSLSSHSHTQFGYRAGLGPQKAAAGDAAT